MQNNYHLSLFGYGNTNQALAQKFFPCKIYDDKFTQSHFDSFGNECLPPSSFIPEQSSIEVITPGIPPNHPLVKRAKNLVSEYDFIAQHLSKRNKKLPFNIWISGTNGKTTTTEMITLLLKSKGAVSGGNIGTPLANLDENAPIWVLETSSFTLHYTQLNLQSLSHPNLYLLLPLSQDHISWHGSYENYIFDKLKPLLSLRDKEMAILPSQVQDHTLVKEAKERGLAHLVFYKNAEDLCKYFGLDIQKIHFKSPFLLDATLALVVERVLFFKANYELLNSFKLGAHKLEEFYDKTGRLFVDDSKATNVDAAQAAIYRYKGKNIHLILGGDIKGADLTPLFKDIKNQGNITIYAIGTSTDIIVELAKSYQVPIISCHTLQNAITSIKDNLLLGEVALLSPAAASLDQFSSYKQRGELFTKLALEE